MDPDGLLLGVILARLWRPWVRSAVAGMIWKTNGSVVALGADPDGGDGDLSADADPDGLPQKGTDFTVKTDGSVVALGGILTAETATSAPARIRTDFCSASSWRGCGGRGHARPWPG